MKILAGDFFQDFRNEFSNLVGCHCICWIETGFITVELNGYLTTYAAGNLFTIYHQIPKVIKCEKLSGYWIIYNGAVNNQFRLMYKNASMIQLFYNRTHPFLPLGHQNIMRLNAFGMAITTASRNGHSIELLSSYLFSCLLYINQFYKDRATNVDAEYQQMVKLTTLIEIHFRTEHHLQFYQNAMGLSRKKMNLLALDILGRPLRLLIRERLLAEAEFLLRQAASIKEITYTLGFCAQSHFSVFYRKLTGRNPSSVKNSNHLKQQLS